MKIATRALVATALLAGCAGPAQQWNPCLRSPPPTLEDHKADCAGINPRTRTDEAMECAFGRLNRYIQESRLWQSDAWHKCGGAGGVAK